MHITHWIAHRLGVDLPAKREEETPMDFLSHAIQREAKRIVEREVKLYRPTRNDRAFKAKKEEEIISCTKKIANYGKEVFGDLCTHDRGRKEIEQIVKDVAIEWCNSFDGAVFAQRIAHRYLAQDFLHPIDNAERISHQGARAIHDVIERQKRDFYHRNLHKLPVYEKQYEGNSPSGSVAASLDDLISLREKFPDSHALEREIDHLEQLYEFVLMSDEITGREISWREKPSKEKRIEIDAKCKQLVKKTKETIDLLPAGESFLMTGGFHQQSGGHMFLVEWQKYHDEEGKDLLRMIIRNPGAGANHHITWKNFLLHPFSSRVPNYYIEDIPADFISKESDFLDQMIALNAGIEGKKKGKPHGFWQKFVALLKMLFAQEEKIADAPYNLIEESLLETKHGKRRTAPEGMRRHREMRKGLCSHKSVSWYLRETLPVELYDAYKQTMGERSLATMKTAAAWEQAIAPILTPKDRKPGEIPAATFLKWGELEERRKQKKG